MKNNNSELEIKLISIEGTGFNSTTTKYMTMPLKAINTTIVIERVCSRLIFVFICGCDLLRILTQNRLQSFFWHAKKNQKISLPLADFVINLINQKKHF